MRGTILVVEDDPDSSVLMRDMLATRGFDARAVDSAEAALDVIREGRVDVVVTDVRLPGKSGIELCEQLAKDKVGVMTIVITGGSDVEPAIAAIRAGAYDYIAKPVRGEALSVAVSRAIEHLALTRELAQLKSKPGHAQPTTGIAGTSQSIKQTIDMVERVAGSDATVLITGESGTGKELVARALHQRSDRAKEPFVAINCGAMPASLLESELFGHVRGAFTDAKTSRAGLFVQAGNGTIFLDEIGEMPLEMQVKLLRVLQQRTVRPVGGDDEVPIHARVVTATNRDLDVEVAEKRFREDLYYRINVVPIHVPPLRARSGDVLQLAHLFLQRAAATTNKPVTGISPPVARVLLEYEWPGNVRELENCIERSVALCRYTEITLDDLPSSITEQTAAKQVTTIVPQTELITIDEMSMRYVKQVMEATKGNKTHAARILGIDRRSLYRRLENKPVAPAETAGAAADSGSMPVEAIESIESIDSGAQPTA